MKTGILKLENYITEECIIKTENDKDFLFETGVLFTGSWGIYNGKNMIDLAKNFGFCDEDLENFMEDKEDSDEVIDYENYLESWNDAERFMADLLYKENMILYTNSGNDYCIEYTEDYFRNVVEKIINEFKEKKGIEFYGIDYSIQESLYGYGFIYSEELEILLSANSMDNYCNEFENITEYNISYVTKREINEEVKDNIDSLLSFTGMTKEEYKRSSFAMKISDLNAHNGHFDQGIQYDLDHREFIKFLINLFNETKKRRGKKN